jgi:ABC transporter DrrB family efflux protein
VSGQPTVTLVAATRALARREVLRSLRTPAITVQSVVFPAMLLMVLLAVFGTAVGEIDGEAYVQRLAPALVISGAAFGSLGAVTGFLNDRDGGVFNRVRLAPFASRREPGMAAVVLARSISEHVRVFATAVAIVLVATAFGFRFEAGVGRAVAFFVVATVAGASFGWIGFALAARGPSMESVVPPVNALFLVLLFFSEGMVPRDAFPGWAQPIVQVAPASVMSQALQRLASGGDVGWLIVGAIAWAVGLTVVFGAITLRGLRR